MKLLFSWLLLLWCLVDHGSSVADPDVVSVSVIEGDSVTLNTSVLTNQQDRIRWYYNNTRIAQINRDISKICRDVQCNEGNERFRDRLKLDHQTGSLTIMNIRNTHSGVYKLQISSGIIDNEKKFSVSVTGVSGVGSDEVSVSLMEGDSVTLHTGVQTNQQEKIRWYYNDTRIAQINGDQSKTCTDVQCNEGTERFRGRLKLDHQTGSLTIMNIRNTDAGVYKLRISSSSSDREKTFCVSVTGVSAAERDKMKSVEEGESVTLDPGLRRKTKDVMMWYFNNTIQILIAEITGDQSKICTDVQCKWRFRDRLKLDHQTGSLIIMNTTDTDSGEYKLQISNNRFSILKTFSVTVTALPDSGLSSTVRAGISADVIIGISAAAVLCVAAAAAVIYYSKQKGNRTLINHQCAKYTAVPDPQMGDPDPQTGGPDPQKGDPDSQTDDPDLQTDDLDQTQDTEEEDANEKMALIHPDSPLEGVANTSHN